MEWNQSGVSNEERNNWNIFTGYIHQSVKWFGKLCEFYGKSKDGLFFIQGMHFLCIIKVTQSRVKSLKALNIFTYLFTTSHSFCRSHISWEKIPLVSD